MKFAEIKKLTDKELVERITEEKLAFQKLNFSHAVSGVENPLKIRTIRKLIARLKTESRQRQIANPVVEINPVAKKSIKKEKTVKELKKEEKSEVTA